MEWQRLPTIKQLQCFIVVAEELNFRRAAERLNMTQPPLTRQIQLLEDSIGCSVLARTTHTVQLTPAGTLLASKSLDILEQLQGLVKSLAHEQDKLRIGVTNMLDFYQIDKFTRFIKQMEYKQQAIFHPHSSRRLLMSLIGGEMDLVFSGDKAILDPSLVYNKIHTEPLLLVLPQNHPATLLQKVSMEDVADMPLFWFPRNYNIGYFDKCEKIFRSLPHDLKRIKEPEDLLMLLNAVSQKKGVALMPQSMCLSQINGLCYRSLTEKYNNLLNIDVYLVHRLNENRKKVIEIIAKIMDFSN